MATEEEIQAIIMQVKGKDKLDELSDAMRVEVAYLQTLNADFAKGLMLPDAYGKASKQCAEAIANLTAQMKPLEEKLDKLEEKGGGFKMRGGMRADLILTNSFRELSNASQTLDQKLERLTMTMPYLLGMMGIGGPWLMGLSFASTAVIELYKNWDHLMALMSGNATSQTTEQIKQMTDKIKELHEAYLKLKNMPTGAEKSEAERLAAFLGERPHAEEAKKGIQQMLARAPHESDAFMTGTEQEEYKELDRKIRTSAVAPAGARERREALRRLANSRYAESMVAQAQKPGPEGEGARARLASLGEQHPEWFPTAGFGADIAQPPPTKAEQAAIEAGGRRNVRDYARAQAREKEEQERHQAEAMHQVRQRIDRDAERKNHELEANARETARRIGADERQQAAEERAEIGQMEAADRPGAKRLRQVKRDLQNVGEAEGVPPVFNEDQVNSMAAETIRNLNLGLTRYQSAYAAIRSQIERMQHASQMFAGPDDTGQFSQATPYLR